MSSTPLPSKEQVEAIASQPHLILRNLQITNSYYLISRAMERLVGKTNASWWTFGMHASKTAGQAIRHETLPPLLKSAMIRAAGYDNTFMYLDNLTELAQTEVDQEQSNKVAAALTQMSLLLSEGNLLIFDELAWLFIEFCPAFWNDWRPDYDGVNDWLAQRLVPGSVNEGGQDYLWEALFTFYEARFETEAKPKAELVLKANCLVGLHEQTRLQPMIKKTLAVPVDTFVKPGGTKGKLQWYVERNLRDTVSQAVTQMMMTYSLPNKELKLGQNVAAPTALVQSFPPNLVSIDDERLQEILVGFSDRFDTLTGSAAADWGKLAHRMRFIVNFFRSYQQYKPLFSPPFTTHQAERISIGRIPKGPL